MTYAPVLPGMYDSAPTLSTPTVGPAACSDRHVDILLARVEAKANADSSGFTLKAARFILQYLAAHGATCGEVITDAAKVAGVRPLNDKHFGPVYQRLAQSVVANGHDDLVTQADIRRQIGSRTHHR